MYRKISAYLSKHHGILLVVITLIGALYRFTHLGAVPVGFHRDEAFLGYNAYAILKTGHDLSGDFLPLHLASFLNSPGGYSYLSIPFVYLFGLSEFSIRFASALFGSLCVLITFFLTREIFRQKPFAISVSLLSSLFLAVSPWHVNLSRVATENVIVVFFISLGVWLFLRWRENKRLIMLILAFICFAVTLTLYQAPRAFLPIFLPLLGVVAFYNSWGKEWKRILLCGGLFVSIVLIPTVFILTSHDLSQRIRMLSVFQHPETQLRINEQAREDGVSNIPPYIVRVFHNKVVSYGHAFLANYADHFSYDFLFTDSGLPDRYRVPGMGLLYLFELPLLLFGVWKLVGENRKQAVLLLGWIAIAPIGSAFTYDDVPNLQRTLIAFPAVSILSAYGGYMLFTSLRSSSQAVRFIMLVAIPVISFYLLLYLHQYYIHQVQHRPWYRQEGAKALVTEVNKRLPSYKKAVITNYESTPGIFFLFYSTYEPARIQSETRGMPPEYLSEGAFGKYVFTHYDCYLEELPVREPISGKIRLQSIRGEEGVLYVQKGSCKLPEENVKKLVDIKRSDGTVAYTLLEYHK